MPKLYEYFGLVVLFYSNEHEPVHVHGKCEGREMRAEFRIRDGRIVDIIYSTVKGREKLKVAELRDFKVTEARADEIVKKWVDYFVMHKPFDSERITRRIK